VELNLNAMLQNNVQITKKTMNNQAVRAMMSVLDETMAQNKSLASELRTFLEEHNIAVENNTEVQKPSFTPSFGRRAGSEGLINLRSSLSTAIEAETLL
jgi:predicted HAD superfamily phosphohydrolase YqeG